MDRRYMYKSKPTPLNLAIKREKDTRKIKEERKSRRTLHFNAQRNISSEGTSLVEETIESKPTKQDKATDRIQALLKYKAEKDAIKNLLKKNSRPPFKVGIPHHGSSPILKDITSINTMKTKPPATKQQSEVHRVTRARARVIPGNIQNTKSPVTMFPFTDLRKSAFNFNLPMVTNKKIKKLTSPHTPNVLKRSTQKIPAGSKNILLTRNQAKRKLIQKPSTSSTDSGELGFPIPPEAEVSPPKDQENVPEPKKEPETVAEQQRLDSETARLLDLANSWEAAALQEKLPQEISDEIDSLVGQTRLLTRDKFNQYRKLITEYENKSGTHPITENDLCGFWDMMYLQVEDLMKRYTSLNDLKQNNWTKPDLQVKRTKRVAKKSQPKVSASSAIRVAVRARRAKAAHISQPEEPTVSISEVSERKSIISKVFPTRRRTNSNSLSPFITMRLSDVGRSLGQTPQGPVPVRGDTTPKNTLMDVIKTEPEENSSQRNLFTDTSSSAEETGKSAEETEKSAEETEKSSEETEKSAEETGKSAEETEKSAEETERSEVVPLQERRKSLRLMGRVSTPFKKTMCSLCPDTPPTRTEDCCTTTLPASSTRPVKACTANQAVVGMSLSSRRQSKRLKAGIFSPNVELENSKSKENLLPTNADGMESDAAEPSTSTKRFVLKPSTLNVVNINYGDGSQARESDLNSEAFQLRRSVRKSARKVTFTASANDKSNMKLPATPYRRSPRSKQAMEHDAD